MKLSRVLPLVSLLACAGEEQISPAATADAAVELPDSGLEVADAAVSDSGVAQDAGLPETLLCGAGHPWPEDVVPVPGQTLVRTETLGVLEGELVLEGAAARYRFPTACTFFIEPGAYVLRVFSAGVEVGSEELDFAGEKTLLISIANHPNTGLRISVLDWSFAPIDTPDTWRYQILNLAPEAFAEPLAVYAFPPGTPRPPLPPDAQPVLLATVPFGQVVEVEASAHYDVFAFVPQSRTASIAALALPGLPCAAPKATEAILVWCDMILDNADPNSACTSVLGATILLRTYDDVRCY